MSPLSGRIGDLLLWVARTGHVRNLWLGRIGVCISEQITDTALVWFSWRITGSSVQVGLVVLMSRAPSWMLGWLAGALVDRNGPAACVVGANLASAAVALAVPVAFAFGQLTEVSLAVVASGFGLARALENTAVAAMTPQIVEPGRLWAMNVMLDNTKRVGRLIGPLICVGLERLVAIPLLFLVVCLGSGGMAAAAWRLSLAVTLEGPKKRPFWSDLRRGWQEVRSDRTVVLTVLCFAAYNPAFAVGLWILLPRFTAVDLPGSTVSYPTAVAAVGLGALISNVVLGVRRLEDPARAARWGFLVTALGFSTLALVGSRGAVFLAFGVVGGGLPLMDIGLPALINGRIALGHQGKAFALFRYLAELGLAAGLVLGGHLATRFEIGACFLGLGAYVLLVVTAFGLLARITDGA